MGIRDFFTSFQSAADSVTLTSHTINSAAEEIRDTLPGLNQQIGRSMALFDDVETAAQTATITLAVVGLVASAALVLAALALARNP